MRRVLAFLTAAATAYGGCLISTDGLSGGPGAATDGGTADGASATLADGGATPGGDATTSEGGVGDAGPAIDDGGFYAGGTTGDWCKGLSPAAKSCFDFDDGDGVSGFNTDLQHGQVSVQNVASSAPGALYSQMNANHMRRRVGSSPHRRRASRRPSAECAIGIIVFAGFVTLRYRSSR